MSTGIFGALGRNRTCDQEIRRLLLYPLSYEGGVGFDCSVPGDDGKLDKVSYNAFVGWITFVVILILISDEKRKGIHLIYMDDGWID